MFKIQNKAGPVWVSSVLAIRVLFIWVWATSPIRRRQGILNSNFGFARLWDMGQMLRILSRCKGQNLWDTALEIKNCQSLNHTRWDGKYHVIPISKRWRRNRQSDPCGIFGQDGFAGTANRVATRFKISRPPALNQMWWGVRSWNMWIQNFVSGKIRV